jgi:hypothetical protein
VPDSCFADTDGDGLLDTWEKAGTIQDCDGSLGGNTPLPDADPNTPNLYVKWDYMNQTSSYAISTTAATNGCPTPGAPHSHQPTTLTDSATCQTYCASHPTACPAMCQVVNAFKSQNVILRFFYDPAATPRAEKHDEIAESEVIALDTTVDPNCSGSRAVSLYTLKAAHFPSFLKPAYHYAVFAHYSQCETDGLSGQVGTCGDCGTDPKTGSGPIWAQSGFSELPGNDFIISRGNDDECPDPSVVGPVKDRYYAGTFMHELGHNLGLHHGGSSDPTFGGFTLDGDYAYKPNYVSVMNYRYQTGIGTGALTCTGTGCTAPPTNYRIDYSGGGLLDLDEGVICTGGCVAGPCPPGTTTSPGLNESLGVGGPSGDLDIVQYTDTSAGMTYYGPSVGRIDWDAEGDAGPTTGDAPVYGNVDAETGSMCTVLHNYNDWQQTHPSAGVTVMQHLRLGFQCNTGNWVDGVAPRASRSWGEQGRKAAIAHHTLYPPLTVIVGARTDCETHFVAPGSAGTLAVVAYGSPAFDVHKVVASSLRFAGAKAGAVKLGDVNGDRVDDLTAEFDMTAIRLAPKDTAADLGGFLTNSQLFGGRARVTVVAGAGPVVTPIADAHGFAATIRPPMDKSLVAYTLDACARTVVDRCGASLGVDASSHVVKITSDEQPSNPPGSPEIELTSPTSFQLRRDRNGGGDGRVYTITFESVDRWKDTTRTTCRIQVPHDASGKPAVDSGPKVCVGPGC